MFLNKSHKINEKDFVLCNLHTLHLHIKNDGSAAGSPEHKASTSQCSDKKSVSVLVTCGIRKAHTGLWTDCSSWCLCQQGTVKQWLKLLLCSASLPTDEMKCQLHFSCWSAPGRQAVPTAWGVCVLTLCETSGSVIGCKSSVGQQELWWEHIIVALVIFCAIN